MKITIEHNTDRLLGSEDIKITIEAHPDEKIFHNYTSQDQVIKTMTDHGIRIIKEIQK